MGATGFRSAGLQAGWGVGCVFAKFAGAVVAAFFVEGVGWRWRRMRWWTIRKRMLGSGRGGGEEGGFGGGLYGEEAVGRCMVDSEGGG